MKKILATLTAALCITMTAMAQTNATVSGKSSDSIPQRNLTQLSLDSLHEEDVDSCQSIMLRHKVKNKSTQFHYKSRPDYTKKVDTFGDVRDRIVRERRVDEGRPLQPLAPNMFRK